MNLTVSKRDLLTRLSRAQGIAEKRSTMPVLANVLLEAKDNTLRISATDLFLADSGTIAATTTKPGSIAVSAKDLFDRAKMMPDGPIDLTEKDGGLILKTKGSARRYTLRGMSGDDFPPLPKPNQGAPQFTLAPGVFSTLIHHCQSAISTDETRAHMNSMLVEVEPGRIRAVATDGHRLVKVELAIESGASERMLIPLKAVRELLRIDEAAYGVAADSRTPITLTHSGPQIFFDHGGSTFSVKLVDAQFPPYEQVIPKSSQHTARVSREALLDAAKAVSIAASDRTNGVRLSFTPGKLLLKSESPDSGDGSDEVPCEYNGPNKSIGCSARYIVDVLAPLTCAEVDIGTSDELDPILWQQVGESPVSLVSVVMPMRI
jgi:DNA polymerase-3 subunit beta